MTKNVIAYSLILMLGFFLLPGPCSANKSRYATLHYPSQKHLKQFNKKLHLNRSLSSSVRKKNIITIEDEVLAKIDTIIERVEVALDMFPAKLHITVVLLPTRKDVAKIYAKKYKKKANHIAYYSLSEDTIYISISDTNLRVLAHEVGHAVVDHYFEVRPPYNIHELMAQFAEKHVTD